jgi:hypothetical protein
METRIVAVFIGTGLLLGTFTCDALISHSEAQTPARERQKQRKEVEPAKVTEKPPEKRDQTESQTMEGKKEEVKSRGLGNMGAPVERRPGGCPEGPPCMDSR